MVPPPWPVVSDGEVFDLCTFETECCVSTRLTDVTASQTKLVPRRVALATACLSDCPFSLYNKQRIQHFPVCCLFHCFAQILFRVKITKSGIMLTALSCGHFVVALPVFCLFILICEHCEACLYQVMGTETVMVPHASLIVLYHFFSSHPTSLVFLKNASQLKTKMQGS